jgi:UDP-N-acetylmuramate dehydrogenase
VIDIPNLQKDIILAPYTTYKIGGSADYFVVAKSKDELVNAVIKARKNNIPHFILGTGANILIGDKGFRGLIIKNEAKNIEIQSNQVIADSGVAIADLIEITKEKELSGLEHYSGIPSTVGGAIWQNLHFLSPDRKSTIFIESVLESAEILDEENKIQKVNKDFFNFGYDYSILHDKEILITEVTFKLTPSSKNEIQNQINENLKWRNDKQPQLIKFPSCGSVFKKIEGVGAGRLIEQVGLKGYRIGGVKVSEKHANYLVNIGNATANDVRNLIKLIQDKVKSDLGYTLQTEISFVGEFN